MWTVAACAVLPLALIVIVGALLIAFGSSREPPPDPAPIVCVGPNGFTTGGDWILGSGTITPIDDETVQVEANNKSLSIVGLAESPPWDRYRVRAQVLDLGGSKNVGLCVALHQQSLAHGKETWFCELTFAERNDGMNPAAKKMQAQGIARLRRYVEPNPPNLPADAQEAISGPRWFDANPGAWRSLIVDVTPEVINFYWDDEPIPLISVPFTPTLENYRKFLASHPPVPNKESLAMNPNGRVGLICEGGIVQFRKVVLEPLPEK